MHPLLRAPYAALGALAEAAAALAPGGNAKWARALYGRRGLRQRYQAFGPLRDASRALIWFHAPSVGEGLQALPVVQRVRASAAPPQVALTWYSPSAARYAQRFAADFSDYLPFDTRRAARMVLGALRPSVLVYSNLDVWPVLTEEAARAGIPVALISATVRPGSGRLRPVARAALQDAYALLSAVGAISADDVERLTTLGVRRDVISVTGDTRYDQALTRARATDRTLTVFAGLESARPTLVAGSTWPSDDAVITEAWERLRAHVPDARLIIAPHEPAGRHLDPLESWATRKKLALARLGSPGVALADVILVDRVGVLAELYAFGDVAYVGGGFHAAGLHATVEPAAQGRPVVFGPGGRGRTDPERLRAAGAAREVDGARALTEALQDWLGNRPGAIEAGRAALRVIESGLGAADRSASLIGELINAPA